MAHFTSDRDPPPRTVELRRYLARKLPESMVPGAFRHLAELPRRPRGKPDRAALARLDVPAMHADREASLVPPRKPVEEIVAEVWAEVLGLPQVGARLKGDFVPRAGWKPALPARSRAAPTGGLEAGAPSAIYVIRGESPVRPPPGPPP